MCYGSGVYGGNINYEPVPEEPRLGIEAKGYPTGVNRNPAPKGMLTVFNVTFKDVKYTVYVDDKKLIQRISTNDPSFKTVEGLAVGDQAEKAIAASKKPPINNANCFYSVILSSGWEAWFGAESVAADGSLAPNSRVTGFAMSAGMKN